MLTNVQLMPSDQQCMDATEEVMKLRRHSASWLAVSKAVNAQQAWEIMLEQTGWLDAYRNRRQK